MLANLITYKSTKDNLCIYESFKFQSFLDGLFFLLRSLAVIVTEEVPGRSSVEVPGLAANEQGNPADGTEDNLIRVPSSFTRCPVAKSWDMTSGGKLLPLVEIEVEVLLEEEVFEEEASNDLL